MEFIRGLGALPTFTGLFGPGWWNVMLDSTTSGHYSPEATILTLGIFALVGLCLAAGFLIKIRWKSDEPTPISSVVKPGEIRALLETALTQRSKMRVSFVRDDPGTRSTDATILAVDRSRGIELEMTSLVRANQSWIGKLVACDFRLRLDPHKDYQNFYAFVAPVLAIAKAGDEFIHMTVAWPGRLDLEQKRAFLRLEPPRSTILTLELWHEAMIRSARGRFSDPTSWGKPLAQRDPRLVPPEVELRNLSGGGIRLDLRPESIHGRVSLFELGGRFVLHLQLTDPEAEEPLDFYLAMRLQNIYGDPEVAGNKAYGFRFLSFGVQGEGSAPNLGWKTAATGVPALDDWCFRRHLEAYRARGE
jgi:hypothetical protein